ncbi:MAG: hypothetical protein FJ012_00240 [Chloroflexi bacterium]|nr:hypothetical protein [Chloroflexota bacterium]
MRQAGEPYQYSECDEHPPDGFRATTCFQALPAACRDAPLVEWMQQVFTQYVSGKLQRRDPVPYAMLCSTELMEKLVNKVSEHLERIGVPVYAGPIPDQSQAQDFADVLDLEGLLNAAVVKLLADPNGYNSWESEMVRRLYAALPTA